MGAVYRFSFDVSPSDLLELDASLGDCILHDPLKAVSLFQSVSCTNEIYKIPNLLISYLTFAYPKTHSHAFSTSKVTEETMSCFVLCLTDHIDIYILETTLYFKQMKMQWLFFRFVICL